MNLSIKDLRAFLALAQERNFTRAAARCFLSQPAFSSLIQGLEIQAGARLFIRTTRAVEMTAEGRLFESNVLPLLRDFEKVFSGLDDQIQGRKGRVTIAALPSIAGGAVPPVIAHFMALHPSIEIILKDVTADACLELVRNRQADFALSASISPGLDLVSEKLMSDTFHLVCREDHPLARKGNLRLTDLATLPMIQFNRSSSIRQHIDAAFYPNQPVVKMEVTNLVTAAGLIASGIGVTLVPTLALFQFQMPTLVAVPVTLPIADREVCLIRRKDGPDSVAAETFIGVIKRQWTSKVAEQLFTPL